MNAKGSFDVIRDCSLSFRSGSSLPHTFLFSRVGNAIAWSLDAGASSVFLVLDVYHGCCAIPPRPAALEKRIVYWSSRARSFFRFSFSASSFFSRLSCSFRSTGNKSILPAWSVSGASLVGFLSFTTRESIDSASP
jgi:hypothetical protein